MKETLNKNKLGSGIYTIPDISRILGFPQPIVRRYINQYWDERLGRKLFSENYSWNVDGKIKAVNFQVLVELYIFFRLQEKGVPTRKILKSRYNIVKDFGISYPFALNAIYTDKRNDILIEMQNALVNTDGSNQTNLIELLEDYVEKLEFNSEGVVKSFWPAGKSSSIVVNPSHQFGQPVIFGTNISAEVLYRMNISGESIQSLSNLFDISEKNVSDAIRFYKTAA